MKFLNKYKPRERKLKVFQNATLGILLLLAIRVSWAAAPPIDTIDPIVLKNEPMPFKPKEYYIAQIEDERVDKKAIAYLYPLPSRATSTVKAIPVDLQGGGHAAIQQFISKSLPTNSGLRPVVMHLKEVNVKETSSANGRVEGRVLVHVTFSLQRGDEKIPLIEHQGGIKYIRPASQLDVVEPALRRSLVESVRYFDEWINEHANNHLMLAKAVKVRFSDYTLDKKDDTVFYNLSRPLNWNDFLASPSGQSKFAAAVYPSFSYEGKNEVRNGVINLDLTMKVFVVKSASWARANAKDTYTLNHEQRHFDIVKLVAERFKQKLHPDSLTVADYNSIMQYKYIESFREMHHLQEQYDSETKHGIDEAAQKRWNLKIDEEMRALKIKR